MVGVLPLPHPIFVRAFVFLSCTWVPISVVNHASPINMAGFQPTVLPSRRPPQVIPILVCLSLSPLYLVSRVPRTEVRTEPGRGSSHGHRPRHIFTSVLPRPAARRLGAPANNATRPPPTPTAVRRVTLLPDGPSRRAVGRGAELG